MKAEDDSLRAITRQRGLKAFTKGEAPSDCEIRRRKVMGKRMRIAREEAALAGEIEW